VTWERRYPLIAPAGDVGGDQQVSEAYNARWVRQLPDGRWSVVSRAYYTAESDGAKVMLEQTEYMVCTDPGDPGSTEVASSDAYAVVTSAPPLDEAAVQDAAREAWAPTNAEWNNQMPGWQVPW
jgi:hypothetical protein